MLDSEERQGNGTGSTGRWLKFYRQRDNLGRCQDSLCGL